MSGLAEVRVSNVDKRSIAGEEPVKLCNYVDVYANRYITGEREFMEATATKGEIERFGLRIGDVIITKDSETPDDIGVPALVVEKIDRLVCGYHLAIIRPGAEIDPVYLAKRLSHHSTARHFALLASGSTRYGLPISAIEGLRIPVPPKPEQAKIGEILVSVDNAIKQTEALIAKQRRIKTGLMQDLLARGIDEHGRIRTEKTHTFVESAVGKIPEGWRVVSVADLFERRVQRGKPDLPVMSIVMGDGLVPRNTVDRRVETALPPEGHAFVGKGDIAYNMMRMWQGVLGKADFDCLVSPAYIVLKPKAGMSSDFAEWLFRDERSILKFRRASRGVVDDRLRLYPEDLFKIQFAVPKLLREQCAIAERFESARREIAAEERVLEKLMSLRAGLMQDLLTGRKRVTALLAKGAVPEVAHAAQ